MWRMTSASVGFGGCAFWGGGNQLQGPEVPTLSWTLLSAVCTLHGYEERELYPGWISLLLSDPLLLRVFKDH